MKKYFGFVIVFSLFSCNKKMEDKEILLHKIDDLQLKLENSYKPGFGEFMSSIQVHHAKLWFAGENQNWKLADFEIKEIKENIDGIISFCKDRTETKSIGMINPSLENLNNSIQQKDKKSFEKEFQNLTNSCNTCHQTNDFEYNVIKIPDNPPFSNQDFKLK